MVQQQRMFRELQARCYDALVLGLHGPSQQGVRLLQKRLAPVAVGLTRGNLRKGTGFPGDFAGQFIDKTDGKRAFGRGIWAPELTGP